MSRNIPVETRGGQVFFVEVEASPGTLPGTRELSGEATPELSPEGEAMGKADRVLDTEIFQRAVEVIKEVSEEVTVGLLASDPRPAEVELGLSLGFDAGGNLWIVKGRASACMHLVLRWRMPDP